MQHSAELSGTGLTSRPDLPRFGERSVRAVQARTCYALLVDPALPSPRCLRDVEVTLSRGSVGVDWLLFDRLEHCCTLRSVTVMHMQPPLDA